MPDQLNKNSRIFHKFYIMKTACNLKNSVTWKLNIIGIIHARCFFDESFFGVTALKKLADFMQSGSFVTWS